MESSPIVVINRFLKITHPCPTERELLACARPRQAMSRRRSMRPRERRHRAAAAVHGRAVEHHRVDFEMAHRVADAFSAAPRSSSGAKVESAYAALGEQACRHFRFLTSDESRNPIRVVFTDSPEPYTYAHELSESVRRDQVLELCPTQRDRDRRHPRLDTSIGGAYDQFRAVHDIISHGWLRHAFDRDGEFSAWLAEHRLYTGLARWALATELHGGHSVRWTTGEPADHKAILLDPTLLTASRRARRNPGPRLNIAGGKDEDRCHHPTGSGHRRSHSPAAPNTTLW